VLGQADFVIISLIAIATLAVKVVEIIMETVKLYCTINAETVTISYTNLALIYGLNGGFCFLL